MSFATDLFTRSLQAHRRAELEINGAVKAQLREALVSCGVTIDITPLSLFVHTTGSDKLIAQLHAEVKERFTLTLNTYQAHFRTIEKLQKQQIQPKQALAKAQERYDAIEAQVKKAGEDAPEKLKGQLAAANGQLLQSKTRFDAIQEQIDAEFTAAREEDLQPFLRARRAEEYTRRLIQVMESKSPRWDDAALRGLQADITSTHAWNPAYAK